MVPVFTVFPKSLSNLDQPATTLHSLSWCPSLVPHAEKDGAGFYKACYAVKEMTDKQSYYWTDGQHTTYLYMICCCRNCPTVWLVVFFLALLR